MGQLRGVFAEIDVPKRARPLNRCADALAVVQAATAR
jgi:hypothetical protein